MRPALLSRAIRPALRQAGAVALSRNFSAASLPPFQYEGLFQSTGPLPYPYRKV